MAKISIDRLVKRWGSFIAVDELSLEIADSELLVLLGPSGCGKTTTMRIVAGLDDPTSGEIRIDGARINDVTARDRDLAMVFQNYGLYPHMTVAGNIGYPLKVRGVARSAREARVRAAAEKVQLGHLLDRRPAQLSGGQRQRVALARAIVRTPRLFLMDEPLSNLDAKLRTSMRAELKHLQRELATTTIYVTHDQIEAMTLADRIALLRDGMIEQLGAPLDLFERPATRFVAGFLGSPKMNFLPATMEAGEAILRDGTKLILPPGHTAPNGKAIVLGLRPQHIAKAGASVAPGHAQLSSIIELVQPTGSRVQVSMPLGGSIITAEVAAHEVTAPGEHIRIDIDMTRAVLIDPQTDKVI